ncbi:MAG: class I SAM-dependent methyltransferase [Bacteroidota bacterium]
MAKVALMKVPYDKIGTNYNLTRKADKFLTQKFLQYLNPKRGGIYLDIGCGTGNYTIELQKKGGQFIGIDPSQNMLEKAKRKNTAVHWKMGSAENTGLPKHHVDGIIAILTIHHWNDLQSGFTELCSILKTEGKIVIFTATPAQMKSYWLNHYFPKTLKASIVQMPSLKCIETAMKCIGIQILETEKYFVRPDLQDSFLYCGKHNPELYLDAQIRQGISSFSSLANEAEVIQGLSELRKDIGSGKINDVIRAYTSDFGDYLFVVGKKLMVNTLNNKTLPRQQR